MTFLSILPMHLSECLIPSIGLSEPVPEKLKLPRTFLGMFYIAYLIEMGRT